MEQGGHETANESSRIGLTPVTLELARRPTPTPGVTPIAAPIPLERSPVSNHLLTDRGGYCLLAAKTAKSGLLGKAEAVVGYSLFMCESSRLDMGSGRNEDLPPKHPILAALFVLFVVLGIGLIVGYVLFSGCILGCPA